jgi:phosphate transport system permease protein
MLMTGLSVPAKRFSSVRNMAKGNVGDRVFKAIAYLFGLSLLFVALALVYELWVKSEVSRHAFGISFLWGTEWNPVTKEFGAFPFIYGTIMTSLFAILLAGPIGIGIAAYLVEIAPGGIGRVLGFMVELLAAIPSVVYGLWGIFVLGPFLDSYIVPIIEPTLGWTPLFEGTFTTFSVFTASLVLALMILPTAASICRDVISAVPNDQREAMLALGATRWEMFVRAVMPYAKSGIIGAIVLAYGRAAGETMAVTMIAGNRPQVFVSGFDQGATMASIIASQFANAGSDVFLSALIELGLVLFILTLVINVLAQLLVYAVSKGPSFGMRA